MIIFRPLLVLLLVALPLPVLATGSANLVLTSSAVGIFCLFVFGIAYLLVMGEEYTQLRKSKPMILAAGLIWTAIAMTASSHGMSREAEEAVRHNLLEYAELMLFLLVAMTYINSMEERGVFDALRAWLIRRGFGFRSLFWITGALSFLISPIADNLTTALLMCAVVMSMSGGNGRFITLGCINIVIAANAGGAFSPFGDITTLMVWQKEKVDFWTFFSLFVPAVVNFAVPALAMHFAIPDEKPQASGERVAMRFGAMIIVLLFVATISTAVAFHTLLYLPPVIGMLTGLGYLQIFGFILKKRFDRLKRKALINQAARVCEDAEVAPESLDDRNWEETVGEVAAFDVFSKIARAEWDTLLFFYGVVLCVGGLGFLGYLALVSDILYGQLGATPANIAIGLLSAVVDNIPVMFAVLTMNPDMAVGQWLLVTLTAGVGGSLLSVGSAAGVALMGQARGHYTFFAHLKWSPVILLGYLASIGVHMLWNASLF